MKKATGDELVGQGDAHASQGSDAGGAAAGPLPRTVPPAGAGSADHGSLVEQLADPELEAEARKTLEHLGHACLRDLVVGLSSPETLAASRDLLHRLIESAPPLGLDLATHRDLLEALPDLPVHARGITALLLIHLASDDQILSTSGELLPFLAETLESRRSVEAKEAALCLARVAAVGTDCGCCLLPDPILEALTRTLTDEDPGLRCASAWALEKCGPAARSAVPVLRDRLADTDALVRRSAAWALESIQDHGEET